MKKRFKDPRQIKTLAFPMLNFIQYPHGYLEMFSEPLRDELLRAGFTRNDKIFIDYSPSNNDAIVFRSETLEVI